LWGSDGRAAGVEVVSMTGTYRLNLKDQGKNGIVILSGGTIGTPDLLFRSGYDHAGLGQGMTIHPVTETFSLDPEHKHFAFRGLPQGIMVRMGNGMAEGAFPDPGVTGLIAVGLKGKGLKDYMALYPHLRIMGGMIEDGARSGGHLKHWRGETFMFYRMSAEDREKLKLLAVEMLRVWAQDKDSKYLRLPVWPFFPSKIDPYYARLGFFGRDEINAFAAFLRDPRIYLMTFAFHPLGTTRQVIEDGETGKLRGIPNVFVADGSALPMTRKNPQVAIGVSALSKGDRLAEKGKIKYA
jgi:choline dehydrogenase-like flavoprotein